MLKRAYIEITNVCNLSCAFCHQNSRTPAFMGTEQFKSILDQVKQVTSYLYLHVQGEPLLHPDFEEILSICDDAKVHVQLVTNGTLLNRYPNLLNHPCLRKISISLQSVEYQQIDSVSVYMDPIIALAESASEKNSCFVESRFWRNDQLALMRTTECLSILHHRYVFTKTGRGKNDRILPNVYVDFDNMFEWPNDTPKTQKTSPVHGRCHGGTDQIAILVDGTVVPCCLDAEGKINLGNLNETPLTKILQSHRYQELCDGFRHGMVVEPFCQSCTFRRRFD